MTTTNELKFNQVLTFGEPLVVFVPNRHGRIDRVEGFTPCVGGAELNTAVGLARLEVPVSFACSIGDDPLGDRIVRAALAEGVDVTAIQRCPNASTGLLLKQWAGLSGNTSVYYYRSTSPMGQGLWRTTEIEQQLENQTWQWVHTTGITCMLNKETRNQSLRLIQRAKQLGVTVSFDVNIRLKLGLIQEWRDMLKQVLPFVDWFFAGDEEAEQLFGQNHVSTVYTCLKEMGFRGKGFVLKRGAQGAVVVTSHLTLSQPAIPVAKVIDTVGAGDGFNAGFIAGLVKGMTLQEALALGAVVGAFAVTSVGDYDGYPTFKEAMELVRGGKELLR
jgi:2-dehydro-3-deoxygluconokinase